jgi:hypothetical protein
VTRSLKEKGQNALNFGYKWVDRQSMPIGKRYIRARFAHLDGQRGDSGLSELDKYLALVRRLTTQEINRSENDLSANFKTALSQFGLYGVVDTGAGSNRRKRPDIALYVTLEAADTGTAADVIVESKKAARDF